MFSYLHSDLSNNKIEALSKEDMKSLNFLKRLLVTRIYTRFMLYPPEEVGERGCFKKVLYREAPLRLTSKALTLNITFF